MHMAATNAVFTRNPSANTKLAARSQIKVEEKELDFVFELVGVQFNQTGQYQLILTAENPLLDNSGSGVRLRVNDGEVLQANSSSTGTIQQTNVDHMYTCSPNKFVFTLPKGYCKNDKNHDVRLKVEAVLLSDSGAEEATKAGEGFFAIYPRTNTPRINLFAGPDEELYQYSGIMALLRTHHDYLAMHCGRLVYTVAFHETRPVITDRSIGRLPPPPSAKPGDDGTGGQGQEKPDGGPPPSSSGPSTRPGRPLPPEENETKALEDPGDFRPSPPPSPQTTEAKLKPMEPDVTLDEDGDSPPLSPRSGVSLKPGWITKLPPPPCGDGLILLPLEDTPLQSPLPLPYTHVLESPRRGGGGAASSLPRPCGHVSRPGEALACVIVHGATSLPALRDGGVPQPYASLATGSSEACGRRSRGVTRGTLQPTHCPSWEETLAVELQDEQARGDVLVLRVADSGSRELLAYYRLPVAHLRPFQHYHLELVQDHPAVPSGVRLYVSVVLRTSILPRQPCFSFTGFEVLLEAMTDSLKNPVGPLLAVARIVADYDLYRDTILLHSPSLAGIAVTLVPFPDPPESAFSLLPLTTHGRPQVSPAGCPQERPVWRHSFLFLGRDCATAFTTGAALVLELYPTTTVMNSVSWHLRSPVGFYMLFLDQSLYRKLMSERGHRGFRVPQLPLQGSHLQTTTGSTPSVSIVLRLIGSERPDSILSEADTRLLPCLDPEQQDESASSMMPPDPPTPLPFPSDPQQEPDPPTSPPLQLSIDPLTPPLPDLQRDSFGLPAYDALAQILPEYQHLLRSARPETQDQGKTDGAQSQNRKDPAQINHTYDIHSPSKRPPIPDFQDSSHSAEVTEQQNKELENYRTAMCKMAEDIIALRSQLAASEAENSHLRSDLSLHQEVGRTLLQDTDVDVMTKAEITDRIASLKIKLASETSKAASQRDKIQQLQNELIKKNDNEKELERLRKAHQQQQAVLHRYQSHGAKMAGLETTVRQQEKVIEKMEKVLDTKLRERNKENTDRKKLNIKDEADGRKKEIECVLAAENARLREELDRMRYQFQPVILQQPAQMTQVFPDREKLSLLSQLERAEARIHTLEDQLKANARAWGREKQSLTTQLREQEHGLARTSTMILHDLPTKSVTESVLGRMRHRQLDPLK